MADNKIPVSKEEAVDKTERTNSSGGYQTTIDEETRNTGVAEATDAKPTAAPESPENDSVVGSPNQGTESR